MTEAWYEYTLYKHQKEVELLTKLKEMGLLSAVSMVSIGTVFMEPDVDYVEYRRRFRKLFDATEKLSRYYMSSDGSRLVVTYNYGEWDVDFFFSNVEEMLNEVSEGKCSVVKEETIKEERRIVCELV